MPTPTAELPFEWYLRLTLVLVGVSALGLLATAATLTPSEDGFGTHQQLGLPPCSFSMMCNGLPCPSCGMTTSWSHMMRGQIIQSFNANPGGALLALSALVAGPWTLLSGASREVVYWSSE